jgi:hypothetical protein
MVGDDEEDTALLLHMFEEAEQYLRSFSWCKSIVESFFGDGIGGIVAIFLFRIEPAHEGVDNWLWVVVGDIPHAYLVVDSCKTPSDALQGYIREMRKWVDLARKGRSSKEVIPVNVPATPEWAEALQSRLDTLEQDILPRFLAPRSIQVSAATEKTQ